MRTKESGKKRGTKQQTRKSQNEQAVIAKITKMHNEIMGMYKCTAQLAIEIGGLLTRQKESLGYGKWLPWVKKNLPFTSRSATNYMKLYKHRKTIKLEGISDLQAAYRALFDLENDGRHHRRTATKKGRKDFANAGLIHENPKAGDYLNRIINDDNVKVMEQMLNYGMAGRYTAVGTSCPYNAGFSYGESYDDAKPYETYLKETLDRFPYYAELLRTGGRVIYVVRDTFRRVEGEDSHDIVSDLITNVSKVAPTLKHYIKTIWDKGPAGRCTTDERYGTYCSPELPLNRPCHEYILVWSKDQWNLANVEGTDPDITEKEFLDWSWSIWTVAPHVKKNNPHPCSYPEKLVERLLKFYTFPHDWILDPYAGVNTTGNVCKRLNRRYTSIEINPNYCAYAADPSVYHVA